MTLAKQNELLKRMASLISQGHTGNAKALGNRIGISRSSVFTYLDRLRTLGEKNVNNCSYPCSRIYVTVTTRSQSMEALW
jgi:hypothetical protein